MIRRFLAALLVAACLTPVLSAQSNSAAIAAVDRGEIFDGFVGPFRISPTGVDVNYSVLCYNPTTRDKRIIAVIVALTDGSTPAQSVAATTAAIVQACGAVGFTVLPTLVFLPVFQRGS